MSLLLQRRYWIFDLDGTITRPIHDFVAIRRDLGVPEGFGILEYIAARPEPEKHRLQQQLTAIEHALAQQAEATPGVLRLLRGLHQQGRQLAILTRNQRQSVTISLQRLGVDALFAPEAIIASEDAPPKPDPSGVRQLLARWQTDPEECLIVGDFLYDLQAGNEAGIAAIHYAADRKDRWPELTDLVVEDYEQLLSALNV